MVFTVGCCVLVVNAVLSFMPFLSLRLHLPGSIIYVEGALSVMSCSLFLLGSIFAFMEALPTNAHSGDYLGWKLDQTQYSESKEAIIEKDAGTLTFPEAHCMHYNSSHADLFGHSRDAALESGSEKGVNYSETTHDRSWRHLLAAGGRTMRHLELGIVANAIFLCGSFIYWNTSIASLVMILTLGRIDRDVRFLQLIAAFGFAIGSVLSIIRIQRNRLRNRWRPAIHSLGWHINVWNLVGSAGFIFCAYFGLWDARWSGFPFGASYLIGSWAMLFGSVIQWYRALHKNNNAAEKSIEWG